MKQLADDNFKFDENSRKFSIRVENTVGKGEIARYEQFLLFPQCLQKASKAVIVWEWVNIMGRIPNGRHERYDYTVIFNVIAVIWPINSLILRHQGQSIPPTIATLPPL